MLKLRYGGVMETSTCAGICQVPLLLKPQSSCPFIHGNLNVTVKQTSVILVMSGEN